MALSGDLRNIKLADIFQTLSMNRQTGMLVLKSGSVEKRIFFSPGGVSLFSRRTLGALRLGSHLVGAGKLSEEEIQGALSYQKKKKILLGEALTELGACQEEDVEAIVRYHVAEELYEIFAWDQGTFEFHEADSSDVDPAATPFSTVVFDPAGVVMEAARRIDEWDHIRLLIPDDGAFYVPSGLQSGELEKDVWGYDAAAVYALADGTRSLAEILDGYHLSHFDTATVLAGLVKEGLLREAKFPELTTSAWTFLEDGKYDRAALCLNMAQQLEPGDPTILEKLVECHEATDDRFAAAEALLKLGRFYLDDGQLSDAVNAFERATKNNPGSPEPRTILMELYRDLGDLNGAADQARTAAELLVEKDEVEEAIQLCYQGLEIAPQHVPLRSALASAYLRAGDVDLALVELEQIAENLKRGGNSRWLEEVCRKILDLDPTRREYAERLNALRFERIQRKRRILRTSAIAGVGVLLLIISLVFFTTGSSASETIWEAWNRFNQGDLAGAEALAHQVLAEGHGIEATLEARNVLDAVTRRRTKASEPATAARAELEKRLQGEFQPAQKAIEGGDFAVGLQCLLNLTDLLRERETAKLFQAVGQQAATEIKKDLVIAISSLLEMYAEQLDSDSHKRETEVWSLRQFAEKPQTLDMQRKLAIRAEELWKATRSESRRENISIAEAIELEVLDGSTKLFPRIQKAAETLDELCVEAEEYYHRFRAPVLKDDIYQAFANTKKLSAELMIQGRLEEARDLHRAFLEECSRLERMEPRQHYGPLATELLDEGGLDLDGKMDTDLRQVETILETIQRAESLLHEGDLESANWMLRTLVHENFRVNLGDRVRLAMLLKTTPPGAFVTLTTNMQEPTSLGRTSGDGMLIRYPAAGVCRIQIDKPSFESVELRIEAISKELDPVRQIHLKKIPLWATHESGPVQGGLGRRRSQVLVPSRDGHLRTFTLEDGEITADLDSALLAGLVGEPLQVGRRAILRSPPAKLLAVDLEKQAFAWEFEADGALRGDAVLCRDLVIAADDRGTVYALREGREIWRSKAGGRIHSSPAADTDRIYLSTTDGRVMALKAADGAPVWEQQVDGPVYGPLCVLGGDLLVVPSDDAKLVAINAGNGRVRWTFNTDNAPRGRVVLDGSALCFATVGGSIYRVDADTGEELARFNDPEQVPFEHGVCSRLGRIFAANARGNLYCLAEDATLLWEYVLPDVSIGPPLLVGDRIYLATRSGSIFCFEE